MAWPTTDDPKTEFATLRMTATEAAELDAYAQSRSISRSAAVRECVARVVAVEKKRAAGSKG